MVYNSGLLQPTLSPKQVHFYAWSKGVMSVFRRPDLEISATQVYLFTTKKVKPLLVSVLFQNSPLSILALLFLTLIFSPLGERSNASSRIHINLVGGVYFSKSHYWFLTFWSSSCRKRVLRLEINDPINHFH
ncbi:hypothetical protein AVEN_58023-1 [Araneus ventricosus]|uniref:Uncharacterized protein n=1 Tax=Araneus ventricosus TaxID=182803 RepID=A0A4Y2SPM0_ARAVE|nr:hypothetical protein AVEN_58023-1 [Araneus ventricosus]